MGSMYVDLDVLRELIKLENLKLINDFKKLDEKTQPPLSIGQVALRYGVVKATVHNWINDGIITGFKIGKGRFFDLSEIEIGLKDYERYTGVVERRKRRRRKTN